MWDVGPRHLEVCSPFVSQWKRMKEGDGTKQIIRTSFPHLHMQKDEWPWSLLERYTRRYRKEETRVAKIRAMRFPTQTPVK